MSGSAKHTHATASKKRSRSRGNPKAHPSTYSGPSSTASNLASTFTLQSTQHNLKTLPDNTILLHATNCLGLWGAGIAKAIADIWPAANDVYAVHCHGARKGDLEGTCLLIPSQENDTESSTAEPKVWIACLFTSYGYGRQTKKKPGKDSKAKIVEYTGRALADLRRQLEEIVDGEDGTEGREMQVEQNGAKEEGTMDASDDAGGDSGPKIVIYSPQFNSGAFGVPWNETEAKIKEAFAGWNGEWFILPPA